MTPKFTGYHRPVLLDQTLEALAIRPDGIYLDGTAGGGGHSHAIASRLTTGRLVALDQDPDAIAAAGARLEGLPATVVRSNFMYMHQVLQQLEIPAVDGILLDIGVSSHQLDAAERGFSYHADAPLDMRMSQQGESAADLVARLDERQLADIFFRYGEEKFSRPIARAIVRQREHAPITTTLQLAELICNNVPAAARRDGHPARRVFQALRIAVNKELDCLSAALDAAFDCLAPGGRLAVITFHSLEDAMVKNRFAAWRQGCTCPREFPVCRCGRTPAAQLVLRKPATATPQELEENPRSRSAKLRCIEKIHDRYPD
ncbi:MAG: 16S rRNA (cytosine(1402)-N(4))-methyltransferase RsmH [Ruminococcaceae bacterium]|nr:16S rRNA (cytosine(1402)-N(4))-methyltransferase RsmH [Oscillospiraceae bacterium]